MNRDKQRGYEFTLGVLQCLATSALGIFAALFIGQMALNFLAVGVDSSDIDGFRRSGLRIHLDAKTGIEYLSDGNGGLIRRYPEKYEIRLSE